MRFEAQTIVIRDQHQAARQQACEEQKREKVSSRTLSGVVIQEK